MFERLLNLPNMNRQDLHHELIDLSASIVELYKQNSDPEFNSLIGEYGTLEKSGNYPVRLSESYIKEFEEKHDIKIPQTIREIMVTHGEHPLCYFFTAAPNVSEFLEPTYVIRENLFKIFISNEVSIRAIEAFKSDYTEYYDPIKDQFFSEKIDAIYQKHKLKNELNFDVILNTFQDAQVLLTTAHAGKLVSVNAGDKLVTINGKDHHQPHYFILHESNEQAIDALQLNCINSFVQRIKEKVAQTIAKIR